MSITLGDLGLVAVGALLLWYTQYLLKQGFPKDNDRVPAAVAGVFCLLLAFASVLNLVHRIVTELRLLDIVVLLILGLASYFAGRQIAQIGVIKR